MSTALVAFPRLCPLSRDLCTCRACKTVKALQVALNVEESVGVGPRMKGVMYYGLVPSCRFEIDTPRVNSEAPIGLIKKTSTNR